MVLCLSGKQRACHDGMTTPRVQRSRCGDLDSTVFVRYREQCGENLGFALRTPKELIYSMLIDDGSLLCKPTVCSAPTSLLRQKPLKSVACDLIESRM